MILFTNERILIFFELTFQGGIKNCSEITMIINNNNSKRQHISYIMEELYHTQ
jgi:hypothetical protein